MEGVDFSIESVDMSSSLQRADSWTVLLLTLPPSTVTHTVSGHTHTHTHTHTQSAQYVQFI